MELGKFGKSNAVIGNRDDEFSVHLVGDDEDRVIILWELNLFERLVVLFTGRIWQQSLTMGEGLQATSIGVEEPFMDDSDDRVVGNIESNTKVTRK